MVDAARHPNIDIRTYTEVERVDGFVGNFNVLLRQKSKYVIADRCNGCGQCVSYCPVEMPDLFNMGLSKSKCLYIPFPQAVPAKYVINPAYCRYTLRRECKQCEPVCKDLKAIDLKQKEQLMEVEVGTIIVATGFDTFNPALKPELGYGLYPNVITGLEFERLSSASGPTSGAVTINGKKLSLDDIEHNILRPRFKDPRVHFAINCAAKSCPPLASEPFLGATLDSQLDKVTSDFVNAAGSYRLEADTLWVSSIFKWFSGDFNDDPAGFCRTYAKGELKKQLDEKGDRIKVKFLDYDWSLNGM